VAPVRPAAASASAAVSDEALDDGVPVASGDAVGW
jgi:hypothetical protein